MGTLHLDICTEETVTTSSKLSDKVVALHAGNIEDKLSTFIILSSTQKVLFNIYCGRIVRGP